MLVYTILMKLKNADQEEIVGQDWFVHEQAEKVRETNRDLKSLIEDLEEKKLIDRLTEELEHAKENLRIYIISDKDIVSTKEILASEKTELKIRRSILSDLLVQYAANHKVQSIEVQGENHMISLTGKIGKMIKEQLELPL